MQARLLNAGMSAGPRLLNAGPRLLNARMQGPVCSMQGPRLPRAGPRLLNAGAPVCSMQGPPSAQCTRLLNAGACLLNAGARLLNAGPRLLNAGPRLLSAGPVCFFFCSDNRRRFVSHKNSAPASHNKTRRKQVTFHVVDKRGVPVRTESPRKPQL